MPCENNANKKLIIENKEVNGNKDTMEQQVNEVTKLKFVDLCSGIGGFHFGLKKHNCMLACDINKRCRESYETNFNIKIA